MSREEEEGESGWPGPAPPRPAPPPPGDARPPAPPPSRPPSRAQLSAPSPGHFLDAIVPRSLWPHGVPGHGGPYLAPINLLLGHWQPGTRPQQPNITDRCRQDWQPLVEFVRQWPRCAITQAKFSKTSPVVLFFFFYLMAESNDLQQQPGNQITSQAFGS